LIIENEGRKVEEHTNQLVPRITHNLWDSEQPVMRGTENKNYATSASLRFAFLIPIMPRAPKPMSITVPGSGTVAT
jgi:hypothetical protein